jgi:hypothetical protein
MKPKHDWNGQVTDDEIRAVAQTLLDTTIQEEVENMTISEVRAELRRRGIDAEAALARIRARAAEFTRPKG